MKKKNRGDEASDLHLSGGGDQHKDKRRKNHFVDYYACSLGYGRKKGKRIRALNWVEGVEEPESVSEESDLIERMKEEVAKKELEGKVKKPWIIWIVWKKNLSSFFITIVKAIIRFQRL